MTRVKIIKGTPIYLYKGTQYLEKPEKCNTKRMLYDENENITYIKCVKQNYVYELLCCIIILGCVIFNNFIYEKPVIDFKYNSIVQYYDDKLFLNLTNPDTNEIPITVELVDNNDVVNKFTLNPGFSIVSVSIDNPKDNYVLRLSCKYMFFNITDEVNISVVRKD